MSYTNISNSIFNDQNIDGNEKFLLITLIRFYNKNFGYSYPTRDQLSEIIGTSKKKTISDRLKSLEDKGYIKIEKKGRKNVYYILNHMLEDSKGNIIPMKSKKEVKKITLCDDTKELLDKLFPSVSIDEFETGLSNHIDADIYNAIFDLESSNGIKNPIGFIIQKIKGNVKNEQVSG